MARSTSKKKNTKKKKKSKGAGAGWLASIAESDLFSLGRPWAVAVAWIVFGAGVAVAWTLGVPELRASVSAAHTTQRMQVEFIALPPWVNGDLLAMLDLTARGALDVDPMRRDSLVDVRNALLSTGWFESIEQVRRVRAELVEIEATFVRPAAVIRDEEGDHLVDPGGALLPRTFPHDGAKKQLVIDGVHFARPQRPGVQWGGADVTAALRLLRLLDARPWRHQVAAIDAGRYMTEETLIIVTDRGARIIWGSAPGDESALEVTAESKLAYLDAAYREFNRIDTGHTGELHFYERGYFAE